MKSKKLIGAVLSAALLFSTASTLGSSVTVQAASTQNAVSATAFAKSKNGKVNSVQVQWSKDGNFSKYEVYRSKSPNGNFTKVYEGTGASFQDNDLSLGDWYYKVVMDGWAETDVVKVNTHEMPGNLRTYNNVTGSSMHGKNDIYANGVYYSYRYVSDSNGMNRIDEYTSRDGENYSFSKTVLNKSDNWQLGDCKLEALNFKYVPKLNKVVLWAHWEKKSGYADGKALVATAAPGGNFTVNGVFNPCDIEVRDMNLFIDDDSTGYLVAASNKHGQGANRTMYIFELTSDFTGAKRVVKTLFDNQYREAPALVKKDGYYYLYTSQAAGWFPSCAKYSSTTDLGGNWSELRDIGNTSTFSCQSGGISTIGEGNNKKYFIMANRWLRGEGTASQVALPITMSKGYAFTDYWTNILYNTETGEEVPCQDGKLLSQDRPITSNVGTASGFEGNKLVDGDYNTAIKANKAQWPFWVQIDLGQVCDLTNIQLSWFMCKGSEGYYKFNVQASDDGRNWKIVANNTNPNDSKVNKTYGFNVNTLNGSGRYVRVNVETAVLHNNPKNNWYTPMIYEMKVYGNPKGGSTPVNPPSPSNKFTVEAENGRQNGVYKSTSRGGYSGSGYVTGFDNGDDSVEVTVNVPESGNYHINTRYASEYGDKYTRLYVNGSDRGEKQLKQSGSFTDAYLDTVYLNAGDNTIKLANNWGYYDIDNFTITKA